jgi:uncharacterized protein YpuA (DUF1002 family)
VTTMTKLSQSELDELVAAIDNEARRAIDALSEVARDAARDGDEEDVRRIVSKIDGVRIGRDRAIYAVRETFS